MTSNGKLVGIGAYPSGGCGCGATPSNQNYALFALLFVGAGALGWVLLRRNR